MTTEERKSQLFAQPSAAKEVFRPDGHYLNGHIIVRGPDALWMRARHAAIERR